MENSNETIIIQQNPNSLKLTKVCRRCSQIKFIDCFYETKGKNPDRKYYVSYCIDCERIVRTETNTRKRGDGTFKYKPVTEKVVKEPKEPKAVKVKVPKAVKVKVLKEPKEPKAVKVKVPKAVKEPKEPKEPKVKTIKTNEQRLHSFNKFTKLNQDILTYLLYKNFSPADITKIINSQLPESVEPYKYRAIQYLISIPYLPKWNPELSPSDDIKTILKNLNIEIVI
jgi:hypothetical protein